MLLRRTASGALVLCALVVSVFPGSSVGEALMGLCAVGLLVTVWTGALRRSPAGRLPWLFEAGGLTLWLLVDSGLPLEGALRQVIWFTGYGLFYSLFGIIIMRRVNDQARAGLIDGITLTTAAMLIMWQIFIVPELGSSPNIDDLLFSSAYLAGNFIMTLAATFVVLTPGRRGRADLLLVGAAGIALLTEVMRHILLRWFPDVHPDILLGPALVAYGMSVAVPWCKDRDGLLTPPRTARTSLHPARVLFLGLAVLAAPLMAVSRGHLDVVERASLTLGTVITVMLSLSRFIGAVNEQTRVQQLLAYQADHDMLTGLANRRAFDDRLHDHRPADGELSVIYLDLDRFKPINDTYGHVAGDAVLVAVADRLRRGVRERDLVARLGGDEFAVLCLGLDRAGQRDLADRLVAAIGEPIEVEGRPLTVGSSVGLASTGDGTDARGLVSRADLAMFDDKSRRSGRERSRPRGVLAEATSCPESLIHWQ